jgi:uncharacterized protein DUF1566
MWSVTRRAMWIIFALATASPALTTETVSAQHAHQRAAVPDGRCWANGVRYVDCRNGTVTDQVTGLIWLQMSDCLGGRGYAQANRAAQALKHGECSLTDKSGAGDWRLPTKPEWEATLLMPPSPCTFPALTNNAGSACWSSGPSSLLNVVSDGYWSSSARFSVELLDPVDWMRFAWKANLGVAGLEPTLVSDIYRVWPVRSVP